MARKVNGAVQKGYLWQGQLRIVAEMDASGQVTSRFVYGTRVNVPEYMVKGGATYRLITDQLGSVRLVVNASTGVVAQRIDYDEFGVVVSDTSPGFTPFGFAGGLYDPDTKLVRFGARDYDADTGRWTSKDPIGFGGGDMNLYGYAFCDPIDITDISGETPCWIKRIGGLFCNGDSAYEPEYCWPLYENSLRSRKSSAPISDNPHRNPEQPPNDPYRNPPKWFDKIFQVLNWAPRTITPIDYSWIRQKWDDALDKLPKTDY